MIRLRIGHKLALIFVLFAALLLGGTVWLSYRHGRAALEEAVIAELYARALEKQATLEQWLEHSVDELGGIADTPDIATNAQLLIDGSDSFGRQGAHTELVNTLKVHLTEEFSSLFYMDREHGRVLASTEAGDEGQTRNGQPYFLKGQSGPSLDFLDEYSAELHANEFIAAAAVRAGDGRLLGVLAARLELEDMNEIVQRRAGLRQTDDAFLVNAARQYVILPRFLAADQADARSGSVAVDRCLARSSGSVFADGYRGVPALAVYRWLPKYQLCLVVKIDQAEALARAQEFSKDLGIAGILILLLASGFAILLARMISRPVRLLEAGIVRIAGGARSIRLPEASDDELGSLARAFNRMTVTLSEKEAALRDHALELEERVAAKTRELAERAQELTRSNQELERFAYVASHDLQEPLRMVASYTQLLGRRYKGKLDTDADEFITYAVDGATRMQALINDLLVYSRVSTKGQAFQPIDIGSIVDRALANLQAAREESGAIINCDALPTIDGDASQLMQLFQNLIANAIKFRGDRRPEIHIGAVRDDAEWIFTVSDNGIGIDSKYVDQLFVIFKRLHTRTEYPGTGIGLAVCKKIVERHGGDIWIESVPQQGTTFYFTIPDRAAAGAPAPAADGIAAAA